MSEEEYPARTAMRLVPKCPAHATAKGHEFHWDRIGETGFWMRPDEPDHRVCWVGWYTLEKTP